MTEPEAHALAERLRRVWVPEKVLKNTLYSMVFRAVVNGAHLVVLRSSIGNLLYLLRRLDGDYSRTVLSYRSDGSMVERRFEHAELAAQWLPFFRRSVWLSGADIEATAHEKADWIRGFTREEAEKWDLKF